MRLGWNIPEFNYYSTQWPSVNVCKSADTLKFPGAFRQDHQIPTDATGAPTAAWSTVQLTLNIVNAEPGGVYGLAATKTVITVDADHDAMSYPDSTIVTLSGNSKVPNNNYALTDVISYRKFALTYTISEESGPSGQVIIYRVGFESPPTAYMNMLTHAPSGNYDFYNGANVAFSWGGNAGNYGLNAGSWGTHSVTPTTSGITLKPGGDWSSGANFKCIMPGFKDAYEAGTTFWHPTYLSLLGANNSACLRHMDSLKTNSSNVRTWSHRTPPTVYNSLSGREIHRSCRITASTSGEYSAFYGNANTLTMTCPSHGLTSGDNITIKYTNGVPNRYYAGGPAEVIDSNTLRLWVGDAQTTQITWGWIRADINQGVSYEDLISLHNLLHLDIWVCIPHLADDNYVMQMATLFATGLDAGLKIYVEYSNETWNPGGAFLQSYYCDNMARLDATYNNRHKWAGKRARECFALWDAAYVAAGVADPRTRVYRVAPTQFSSVWVTQQYLFGLTDPVSGKVKADVLAVAAYYDNNYVAYTTLDELKDRCLTYINGTMASRIVDRKALCNATVNDVGNALKLVCYEGGQSVLDNNAIAQAFADSTQRYDCDVALFAAAEAGGVDLWNHYTFMYQASPYTSYYFQWGALQYMDDVATSQYRPTWAAVSEYFGGAVPDPDPGPSGGAGDYFAITNIFDPLPAIGQTNITSGWSDSFGFLNLFDPLPPFAITSTIVFGFFEPFPWAFGLLGSIPYDTVGTAIADGDVSACINANVGIYASDNASVAIYPYVASSVEIET